ncbi:MAG TPA: hypothetical protein VJ697_13950 [Nitrososphaeraceae archaeon]|jgi:hypothetical protein|nr:hypothetical protein [Nitrososphaeraceae archaeon]
MEVAGNNKIYWEAFFMFIHNKSLAMYEWKYYQNKILRLLLMFQKLESA